MMKTFFLDSLSKALNAYLALDPDSTLRLQKLNGKTITIELLPLHFIFQCEFNSQGVNIKEDALLPAEAKLCGTPLQMLGMMLTKNNRHHFFADDLIIEGDAELGQQIISIFDELEIDWEEQLSHLTGDVSAHHISRFIRNMQSWLQQTENTFAQNINEYVHEEAKWLPANEALQDFFADIDVLRMDVDRLDARIIHLQKQLLPNEEDDG